MDATGWHSVIALPVTTEERDALLRAGESIADQLAVWRRAS